MDARRRQFVALVLPALLPAGLFGQISFYGIGDLAGGDSNSQVRAATRAGGNIVAVGAGTQYVTGTTAASGDTPVIWIQGSGLSALPEIDGSAATATRFVTGRAISADGSIIGGSVHNSATVRSGEASLWTSGGASVSGLGYLGSFTVANGTNGAVNGLSADGSVAYGFSAYNTTGLQQAFRYTAGTGKVALGFLNAGDDGSYASAHAVSADGTVMIGTSFNSATADNVAGYGPGNQVFRYTYTGSGPTGGTMAAMSFLSGGTWSSPLALTADGSLAFGVGDSTSYANGELVRWNAAGVATALGAPSATAVLNNLGGVTGDGSVLVVAAELPGNIHESYFYNANGWFNLQTAMSVAGLDLTGWALENVIGISPDGTLLYGTGLHNGAFEGFVIDLPAGYLAGVTSIPEPSVTAALLAMAAIGAVILRRRRATLTG